MTRCKVCGRPARGWYDSLCFGVHANCANHIEVLEITLYRVREGLTGKTWYCTNNGMLVVDHPKQWMEGIKEKPQ